MQSIPVSEAFGIAPPRRPAVLCLPGPDGSTDLIATQWFTWLNLKRNPMLSYALERSANLGLNVETDGVAFFGNGSNGLHVGLQRVEGRYVGDGDHQVVEAGIGYLHRQVEF